MAEFDIMLVTISNIIVNVVSISIASIVQQLVVNFNDCFQNRVYVRSCAENNEQLNQYEDHVNKKDFMNFENCGSICVLSDIVARDGVLALM